MVVQQNELEAVQKADEVGHLKVRVSASVR